MKRCPACRGVLLRLDDDGRLACLLCGREPVNDTTPLVRPKKPPPKVKPSGRPKGTTVLNGCWSLAHDACVECGTTDRRHASNGRCGRCHERARKGRRKAVGFA